MYACKNIFLFHDERRDFDENHSDIFKMYLM